MMKQIAGATLAAAQVLTAAACGPRPDPEMVKKGLAIAEGDKAPDFTLASDGGESVTLSALLGKAVILYFYPKDETPGCTKEACSFRDNMKLFEEMGVHVLGISLDTRESHDKFKKAHMLNFPLLSDPEGEAVTAYGAWKSKGSRVSALSINRSTFAIDASGVIRKIWRNVSVSGHADEVLAFAKTL